MKLHRATWAPPPSTSRTTRSEAVTLADKVVVLRDRADRGRWARRCSCATSPPIQFVAQFIGTRR